MKAHSRNAPLGERGGLPRWLSHFWPMIAISIVGVGLSAYLTVQGLPCPRGDDAVYKSPAAELAQNGRLAVPCFTGFLVEADRIFLQYPPLYQLLLAGWYSVLGVSLESSLAFHFAVHLANTLALMELARRLLAARREVQPGVAKTIVLLVGLIQLANIAYFDRPEETALLWIWAEILWVQGMFVRPGFARAAASGLLVGLAGLTAPWVGFVGAAVVVLRAAFTFARQPLGTPAGRLMQAAGHVAVVGAMATILSAGWCGAMMWFYGDTFHQQFFGTVEFLKQTQGVDSLGARIARFVATVSYNPAQIPAMLLTLVLLPMVLAKRGWRRIEPLTLAMASTALLGFCLLFLFRPGAYTYFGATQLVLLGCFAPAMARLTAGDWASARLGLAIVALCAIVACRDVGTAVVASRGLPAAERAAGAFAALTATIPEDDLVAVTPRHWHAFQGRNAWRDAYFSSLRTPEEVLRCDWLVLTEDVGRPPFIAAFTLVEEVPSTSRIGYGYSLWRRKVGEQFTQLDRSSGKTASALPDAE